MLRHLLNSLEKNGFYEQHGFNVCTIKMGMGLQFLGHSVYFVLQ